MKPSNSKNSLGWSTNRASRDFGESTTLIDSDVEIENLLPSYGTAGARGGYYSGHFSEHDDGYDRDEELDRAYSADEYEARLPRVSQNLGKLQKTSRQRRKQVARGGIGNPNHIQSTSRASKPRRISVHPISSSVKVDALYDALNIYKDWKISIHGDEVIRLFKPGKLPLQIGVGVGVTDTISSVGAGGSGEGNVSDNDQGRYSPAGTSTGLQIGQGSPSYSQTNENIFSSSATGYDDGIWNIGTQEIFIYEFGVVITWGLPESSLFEKNFLSTVQKYSIKPLSNDDIEGGEDDMAFRLDDSSSNEDGDHDQSYNRIRVINDIIILNEDSALQRLAISYAIAQSAILAIFESRVDKKMELYKYIPETLAKTGAVHVPHKILGQMVGEVFVIRHDVNLHSDILDNPDILWNDDRYEREYVMLKNYLEINTRVTVLNTRIDMLRELLEVLQAQAENEHGTNLEWIVIWLIVAEVVLQLLSMYVGVGNTSL